YTPPRPPFSPGTQSTTPSAPGVYSPPLYPTEGIRSWDDVLTILEMARRQDQIDRAKKWALDNGAPEEEIRRILGPHIGEWDEAGTLWRLGDKYRKQNSTPALNLSPELVKDLQAFTDYQARLKAMLQEREGARVPKSPCDKDNPSCVVTRPTRDGRAHYLIQV